MTAFRRKLLLVFTIIGLAASGMSSYVHYRLLTDPSYTSFCDVNASLNCTQAYLSRFGSLWAVPVALWGVLFFAIVLFLLIAARSHSAARETIPGYIFLMSTIGLAIVLYLAWASFFQLHTVCLFCATTYIAVIAIFILSGGALTMPVAALPRRVGSDVRSLGSSPGAVAVLLLLVAGIGAAIAWFPRESAAVTTEAAAFPPLTDQQRADTEKWWAVQPKVDLPIPNDGAKVLVVKFSDYMCPACRQTYEFYKPVLGKYLAGGEVRYVVKHYPLEAECNPSAPNNHYASCEAAAAVIMAKPLGTAEKLEQWIFSNQIGLTPEAVRGAAKDIGTIQDFDAQYQTALQEVKADATLGAKMNVSQTPTFYINGRKLIGNTITPPQYFDYLIELALKDSK
ncbi:MAG TPA: vitamin K epoxide reductase family protein [Vicinamibacterales bacterium]|nr:vitamin K epoxide reductase family protein [Vicinamibacterales bacterium]